MDEILDYILLALGLAVVLGGLTGLVGALWALAEAWVFNEDDRDA
jgi:hypothetical protein